MKITLSKEELKDRLIQRMKDDQGYEIMMEQPKEMQEMGMKVISDGIEAVLKNETLHNIFFDIAMDNVLKIIEATQVEDDGENEAKAVIEVTDEPLAFGIN